MIPSAQWARSTTQSRNPSRMIRLSLLLLLAPAVLGAQSSFPALTPLSPGSQSALEKAEIAWDSGEYPLALRGYQSLLQGRDADRSRRTIALTTGELYHTTELTDDGRGVQLSPGGKYVAYEVGTGAERRAVIHLASDGTKVGEIAGHSLSFSRDDQRLAVMRTGSDAQLEAARATAATLMGAGDRAAYMEALQAVQREESRLTRLVVREVAGGREQMRPLSGLTLTGVPLFGNDGRTIYAMAAAGENAPQPYAILEAGEPRSLTDDKVTAGALTLAPGGRTVIIAEGGRQSPTRPGSTVLVDIATRMATRLDGGLAAVSADGGSLVYLSRANDTTRLNIVDLSTGGLARTIVATTDPLDAPAISPDGRTVAYQRMLIHDWEIFLVNADGTGDRRLTREIQHDLMPRFLTNGRLLAVMGEGRHRRSYLYDVASGERTRLFHNNTVRTIAPEYEWATSADGSRVAIVSERDGDTISPERGVYLVDLTREVTANELLQRLGEMQAAEMELRSRGAAMFAPITDSVRAAVGEVSTTKLYEYQKRLSEFDSRHVSRPGNGPAGQYLFDAFAAMGYQPAMQWFEPRGLPRTANVVATLPGTTHPEVIYVISAHYDSHASGPGADDDASGTAMLLEMARVLRNRPLPATVIFAAFTGEESGLLGSREFVRRAVAESLHVAGALNNDMFGWSNDHRLDNTIRYSNVGIRDVQHAGAFLFSGLITYDAKYYKSTDAHAYYEAYGDIVGGIGSYPVLGNPHYHQSHDLLETVNQALETETTKATLAATMLLASSPERLRDVTVTKDGDAVVARWRPAVERDVTGYQLRYTRRDGTTGTMDVTDATARLTDIKAGTSVQVRAVNRRGLSGWDWATAQ